jgi:hypothetical protein
MAERIPARLTAAAGRRFGLTVGGAFVVIAAISWWRGHPTVSSVIAALGLVLVVAGLIVPTSLGPVERAWMALAHAISKVTTPIVMGVMYLLVMTPMGILRRIFGGNPLVHQEVNASFWRSRPEGARRSNSLKRQF